MKKFSILLIIVTLALSCSKNKNPITDDAEEFAIYLLADSTITAVDAKKQPISSLTLSEEPIISMGDIISYKWDGHSFLLTSEAGNRLEDVVNSRVTVFGIPFVVVVGGERIYLGAFWYLHSSVAPSFPHINVTGFSAEAAPVTLRIEKSWIEEEPDERNNQKVYRALERADLLEY